MTVIRPPGILRVVEDDFTTLHIVLEDVGGTSWWAGVLTTLTSQVGSRLLRFVGSVDGDRRYKGPTFAAPRASRSVPPQEEWAPGMADSLRQVQRDVEADGWAQVGRGTDPWSFQYQRPARRE